MRLLSLLCATLTATVALAVTATPALASNAVVTDCQKHHQTLTHHYSVAQLRAALHAMPDGVKQYTSCYQVIQDQVFLQVGHKGINGNTNGSGGGGFPWLIVVIVVVVLGAGGGAAAVAYRRRESGDGPA